MIDDISLDKYTFIRDAYLQRRRSLVFDGDAAGDAGSARGGGVRGSRRSGRQRRAAGAATRRRHRPPAPVAPALRRRDDTCIAVAL